MARLSQEAYCLNEKQKVSVDFYADINVERVDEKKIDILLKFRCGKILTYEEWLVRRTRVIGFPEIANNRLDMEFWNKGSVGAKILLRKLKEVLKQYPHEILTFYFTGHDVGGVWAVLTAFLLIRGILPTLPRERLIVTTFGQPRFLNGLFCRYMKSIMTIYRVTLKDDYVPSFPVVTRDAFNHFPEEYWISNETCDCTSEPAIVYHCLSDKIPHKWRHEQGEIIFEEHPFCNAQFHGQTPERNVHNGPYFGYTFGSCPQKEQ
ncbi:hypothetical protein G9A89_019152 [Geosiphon pyriformis]|nr:hypothetical protein G9A89_019152 [Geosiphon pyriformis]